MARQSKPSPEQLLEIQNMAEELARLSGEVRGLRSERDRTQEVINLKAEKSELRDQIETLNRERATLVEANDRKIRDTTHKVGLLKKEQELEVRNARRETELEIREGNLKRERETFDNQMKFMTSRLEGEIERISAQFNTAMGLIPDVRTALSVATGHGASSNED